MSLSTSDRADLTAPHQHYQAGRLPEAEALYRPVLDQHSAQTVALIWLALIVD